jgi:proteasome accessory factor A
VLSPSAYLTGAVISSDTMHETGILNTRDEPHGDEYRFRRLHIQIGDALMSEVAISLRQFTTNCVLRLIEQDKLKDIPELTQPLQDLWGIVECTNPEKWSVKVKPSKVFKKREEVSPIDIQRHYLEMAEPLIGSKDDKRLFTIWERTLDLLEKKNTKRLARSVEWLDRFLTIKELSDKGRSEMSVCKRYSETGRERSHFYERQDQELVDRLVTDEEIIRAINEPPEDTRAHARKLVCDKYGNDMMRLDWSSAKVKNKDGDIVDIDLDDPFRSDWR